MAADRIKLGLTTWDSDKDPNGFANWSSNVASIVKSTKHGLDLQRFLDRKLGRDVISSAIVPSFLMLDADFAPLEAKPKDAPKDESKLETPRKDPKAKKALDPVKSPFSGMSGAAPSAQRIDMSSGKAKTSDSDASTSYFALAQEARDLDALMYNVLKIHIKGSKKDLLDSVKFESYVQAIMILEKHVEISQSNRKTKALSDLEALDFKGDVQTWQIDVIKRIKELIESRVTLMDFALLAVMKSLNGKSKTIQYKIAEKINNNEIESVEKVFDLIQEVACAMASVGDGQRQKQSNTNQIKLQGENCSRCGRNNHKKKD